MTIINFSSILQNFGKNVNFGNFQTNCRVNSKICVYVSICPYMISVLFHTFLFTFGKVTDSQSFKNKTNHLISSNSHPSVIANKAIHRLKREGRG